MNSSSSADSLFIVWKFADTTLMYETFVYGYVIFHFLVIIVLILVLNYGRLLLYSIQPESCSKDFEIVFDSTQPILGFIYKTLQYLEVYEL